MYLPLWMHRNPAIRSSSLLLTNTHVTLYGLRVMGKLSPIRVVNVERDQLVQLKRYGM